MTLEREPVDGVTLDECNVFLDDTKLFTAQNVDVTENQDKTLLHGPGNEGKAFGRKRGQKAYTFSMTVIAVNQALLVPPEDFLGNKGTTKSFFINGVEYKSLLDLRNMTLVIRYPDQDGTRKETKLIGVEFNDHASKLSLNEAETRDLSGDAIDQRGFI